MIDPIRVHFDAAALRATFLYNNQTKGRAYYAFPIKQQTMHIQYWKDVLADAASRKATSRRTGKATGPSGAKRSSRPTGSRPARTPSAPASRWAWTRATRSFLTVADAYNVKMVNASGKLLVDDPVVRQRLISAMTDYTSVYAKGCTPPLSTNWKGN